MPENNITDHDILIELRTQMKLVMEEMKKLNEKMDNSPTRAQVDDHELRLRRLETWVAVAIGALFILNFFGDKIINAVFK